MSKVAFHARCCTESGAVIQAEDTQRDVSISPRIVRARTQRCARKVKYDDDQRVWIEVDNTDTSSKN